MPQALSIIEQAAQNFEQAYQEEQAAHETEKIARFCNSLGSCKFIFADGHEADFIGGVFFTSDEREYYELMVQIKSGHPHIFQEKGREVVLRTEMNPLEDAKRKAALYDALMQERAQSMQLGDTDQDAKLEGIGNTATTGALAAESSSSTGAMMSATPSTQAAPAAPGVSTAKVATAATVAAALGK